MPARYRCKFTKQLTKQAVIITKDPQYPSLKVYFGSEWSDNFRPNLNHLQSLDPIVRKITVDYLRKCKRYMTLIHLEECLFLIPSEDLRELCRNK